MRKALFALALLVAPMKAFSQFCPSCVQSSPNPQNATFNLTQGATIQGQLTVGSISIASMTLSGTLTAAQLVGGGAGLTGLNASALASGTVPAARLVGSYTSLTGVGTLTAGAWQATPVGTQYGGTGQNFVAVAAGSLIYFDAPGHMATLAGPSFPQQILQGTAGGSPVWVSSPAVSGANFYNIRLGALQAGNLPTNIIVSSNSIPYVDGASVHGVVNSTAAYYTGPILLSQLVAGTLSTSVVASSITGTGAAPGTYGNGQYAPQIVLRSDGRLASATQLPITVGASSVTTGTFPLTVVLPLSDLQAGVLPTNVIASSVQASGIAPGTYGGPTSIPQCTFGVDGRATSCTAIPFSGPISGTGTAGYDVIWTSSYQVTSGLLLEKLSNVYVSTGSGVYLYGTGGQLVSQSSVTAAYVLGNGASLTHLAAANVDAGYFGPSVIVSSVNARAVGDLQLTTTTVVAGTKGTAARIPQITVDAQGRLTSLTDLLVAITTGQVSGIVQTASGGTGNNWGATATGAVPYFSATGVLSALPAGTNGYSLTMSGGVPAWAAASSSATHLSGGAAGSVPYQSAPNVTTFLPISVNGYALQVVAGLPAWVAAVSSASNVAGGGVNSLPYQSAANTTAMLAAGNGVLQEAAGAPAWTTTPTLTGTNFSGIPASAVIGGVSTGVVTTSALTGNGNSAFPVGVNSSSVAVLSGGYVINAEINPANNSITSMSALAMITSAVTQTSSMTNTSAGGIMTSSMAALTYNNILMVDQFPGASMDVKLTNALAALPATGGILDARGLTGAQALLSTVTINVPVHLILGAATITVWAAPHITTSNVVIDGQGWGQTILKTTNTANGLCIGCGDGNNGGDGLSLNNIQIRHLEIDGNKANNPHYQFNDQYNQGIFIGALGMNHSVIDDVYIHDTVSDGINPTEGVDNIISNSRFVNIGLASATGLTQSAILMSGGTPGSAGPSNYKILHNTIINIGGNAIWLLNGTTTELMNNNVIEDNTIINAAQNAIVLQGSDASGAACTDATQTQNWCGYMSSNTVINNHISVSSQSAIVITGGGALHSCQNNIVSHNVITATGGGQGGYAIENFNCETTMIVNNIVSNGYAAALADASSSSYTFISGNIFNGNTLGVGVYAANSATIWNNVTNSATTIPNTPVANQPVVVQSNGTNFQGQTATDPVNFSWNVSSRYDGAHPWTLQVGPSGPLEEGWGVYSDAVTGGYDMVSPNFNLVVGTNTRSGYTIQAHAQGGLASLALTGTASGATNMKLSEGLSGVTNSGGQWYDIANSKVILGYDTSALHVLTNAGTQIYRCTSGTQAGMLVYGSGTIDVVCTASTPTGLYLP